MLSPVINGVIRSLEWLVSPLVSTRTGRSIVVASGSAYKRIKTRYYQASFGACADDVTLYFPLWIFPPHNLFIGRDVHISAYVHILAHERVEIGNHTIIASGVTITTATHDYRVELMRSRRVNKPVIIGDNVWIGAGAIILPGITVGSGAVIGAGAVVTRNVPENAVVAGVPARVIHENRLA